jgi:hypothetical protein
MTDSRIPHTNYSENGPPIHTSNGEIETKTFYKTARKEYSQDYTISLCVWRSIIPKAKGPNPKLSPLIIELKIRKYGKKFIDRYSFDEKGGCIAHTYVILKNNRVSEKGKEDKNLVILGRHKGDLYQMLSKGPIPESIKKHKTIEDILSSAL